MRRLRCRTRGTPPPLTSFHGADRYRDLPNSSIAPGVLGQVALRRSAPPPLHLANASTRLFRHLFILSGLKAISVTAFTVQHVHCRTRSKAMNDSRRKNRESDDRPERPLVDEFHVRRCVPKVVKRPDPVWLFSPFLVERIDSLYTASRPGLLSEWIPPRDRIKTLGKPSRFHG